MSDVIGLPNLHSLIVAYDHDGEAIKSWVKPTTTRLEDLPADVVEKAHRIVSDNNIVLKDRGCCPVPKVIMGEREKGRMQDPDPARNPRVDEFCASCGAPRPYHAGACRSEGPWVSRAEYERLDREAIAKSVARELDNSLDEGTPLQVAEAKAAAYESAARAYYDAVAAFGKVRPGPLSTSLAWLIEQGHLVPSDPMNGAIDRLRKEMGEAFDTPEVSWALNEAFRNGMRSAQEGVVREATDGVELVEHKCAPPGWIAVEIKGLPYESAYSTIGGFHWPAYLVEEVPNHDTPSVPGAPLYAIDGDPNDKAVGRFKASLRKFLGVS